MTEQSKVTPVEAQAVPDLPVFPGPTVSPDEYARNLLESCANWLETRAQVPQMVAGESGLMGIYAADLRRISAHFTRPTPAAADLHQNPVARINSRVHNCIEWLDANAAANLPNGTPLFTHRPTDDKLWDQTLGERDRYHETADALANAIADHLGIDIGEHSSDNEPWQRALIAIRDAASPAAAAGVPTGLRWRDDMLALLRELRPMADYGRVGTRDIDQGRYQRALDSAIALLAASPVAPVGAPTEAARDVLAERERQKSAEGWTAEHDDEHGDGSMSIAAACYALWDRKGVQVDTVNVGNLWRWTGWGESWFKPKDPRRNLIRAGALILAEIERMDRQGCELATDATKQPQPHTPKAPQ